MLEAIVFIIMFIIVLLVAIIVHEIGHVAYFHNILNKEYVTVKLFYKSFHDFGFKTGEITDYNNMTDKQYYGLLTWGIYAGIIPIFMVGLLYWWPYLLVIVPYLTGCRSDVFEMINIWREHWTQR